MRGTKGSGGARSWWVCGSRAVTFEGSSTGRMATNGIRCSVCGPGVSDAGVDGQPVFAVANVPFTGGSIGLWARAAAAICFSDVTVTVGTSS
jgi:hypothetical protein